MPLPTLMFAGGHSYFVQHQAAAFNTTPYYAHACLVPGHVPAKVVRFKEHSLWALEDDAYYTKGSFLHYENTVQAFIHMLELKAGQVRGHFFLVAALTSSVALIQAAKVLIAATAAPATAQRLRCRCA